MDESMECVKMETNGCCKMDEKWTKNGRVDGVRKNGQKMDAVKWTY